MEPIKTMITILCSKCEKPMLSRVYTTTLEEAILCAVQFGGQGWTVERGYDEELRPTGRDRIYCPDCAKKEKVDGEASG